MPDPCDQCESTYFRLQRLEIRVADLLWSLVRTMQPMPMQIHMRIEDVKREMANSELKVP